MGTSEKSMSKMIGQAHEIFMKLEKFELTSEMRQTIATDNNIARAIVQIASGNYELVQKTKRTILNEKVFGKNFLFKMNRQGSLVSQIDEVKETRESDLKGIAFANASIAQEYISLCVEKNFIPVQQTCIFACWSGNDDPKTESRIIWYAAGIGGPKELYLDGFQLNESAEICTTNNKFYIAVAKNN